MEAESDKLVYDGESSLLTEAYRCQGAIVDHWHRDSFDHQKGQF